MAKVVSIEIRLQAKADDTGASRRTHISPQPVRA